MCLLSHTYENYFENRHKIIDFIHRLVHYKLVSLEGITCTLLDLKLRIRQKSVKNNSETLAVIRHFSVNKNCPPLLRTLFSLMRYQVEV